MLAASAFAAPFLPPRDPQCVDWSSDGRWIATGISGESSGEATPKPHPSPRKCGVVLLWDAAEAKVLHRIETFGDLTALRFSPDDKLLACSRVFSPGEGAPWNEVRVWRSDTAAEAHHFDRCHAFAFAPDSSKIAVVSRTKCVLYDLKTGEKRHEVPPLGGALSVVWSGDGKLLAGVIVRDGKYVVRICGADSGQTCGESLLIVDPFYSLAFAPDSKTLASGHGNGIVLVWNTGALDPDQPAPTDPNEQPPKMRPVGRLEAETDELMFPFFSKDGKILAAGGEEKGTVLMWEPATGKEVARFFSDRCTFRPLYKRPADVLVRPERAPNRFCFGPRAETFMTGCAGGTVRRTIDGGQVKQLGDY